MTALCSAQAQQQQGDKHSPGTNGDHDTFIIDRVGLEEFLPRSAFLGHGVNFLSLCGNMMNGEWNHFEVFVFSIF